MLLLPGQEVKGQGTVQLSRVLLEIGSIGKKSQSSNGSIPGMIM